MQLILSLLLASTAVADPLDGLKELLDMADKSPEKLVREVIQQSPLKAIVAAPSPEELADADRTAQVSEYPWITAHGMGDSCYNPGMFQITHTLGAHGMTYARCIPTGKNLLTDTINGFLLSMDKSVDVFAASIKADPKLAKGFYAAGFSQGNSLIRGYIQKYNDPPVMGFLSVHGTVSGVAAFPNCNPAKNKTLGKLCEVFDDVLDIAYTDFVQEHLFQADYFRDPRRTTGAAYKAHSQLGVWNNEVGTINATYKANFEKTKLYVMVKALKDSMVFPNEGEHWGAFAPDFSTTLQMKDMDWYKQDLFGLQTVDKAGGIHFETTDGDHLQFTIKQLTGWVDQYFLKKEVAELMI